MDWIRPRLSQRGSPAHLAPTHLLEGIVRALDRSATANQHRTDRAPPANRPVPDPEACTAACGRPDRSDGRRGRSSRHAAPRADGSASARTATSRRPPIVRSGCEPRVADAAAGASAHGRRNSDRGLRAASGAQPARLTPTQLSRCSRKAKGRAPEECGSPRARSSTTGLLGEVARAARSLGRARRALRRRPTGVFIPHLGDEDHRASVVSSGQRPAPECGRRRPLLFFQLIRSQSPLKHDAASADALAWSSRTSRRSCSTSAARFSPAAQRSPSSPPRSPGCPGGGLGEMTGSTSFRRSTSEQHDF